MSISTEISRIQGAKSTLKTKLNAKNDNEHQITDETIDEYGDFVDSIVKLNGETATVTPTTSQQIITPTGTGKNALTSVTVNAVTSAIDNNITAGNIKKDVSILGVTGSYEGTDTSDATATAGDILKDKTAYVNGQKITGTLEVPKYFKLDYIESTGTQYLSVNYALNSNNGFEIEYYKVGSTNSYECIMGSAGDNRYQLFYSWESSSNKLEIKIGSTDYKINASYNSKHTLSVSKTGVYTLDNNSTTLESMKNTDNYPFYIFAGKRFADSAAIVFGKFRLYKFKIYENDTLIYDFIPVIRYSDKVVCMYDKVSNEFYTNQGTGTFNYGSIIDFE